MVQRIAIAAFAACSLLGATVYSDGVQATPPPQMAAMGEELLFKLAFHEPQSLEASFSLGELLRRGIPILPRLETAYETANEEQREHLVSVLVRITSIEPAAWSALTQRFNDPSPRVRQATTLAFVSAAPSTFSVLINLLEQGDSHTRATAAQALLQVPPPAEAHAPLACALLDDDLAVVASAAQALAQAGESALPLLVDALASEDEEARRYAIAALRRMGKTAASAAPALEKVVQQDVADSLKVFARLALDAVSPGRKENIAPLEAALASSDASTRESALDQLISLEDDALAASPAIIRAMDDPVAEVRYKASYLVGRLNTIPPEFLEPLLKHLGDSDESVRHSASSSLGKLGLAAVPGVLAALESGNVNEREAAALALDEGVAVAGGPEVVEAIRKALPRCSGLTWMLQGRTCEYLLDALGEMGERAAPAVEEVWEHAADYGDDAGRALVAMGEVGFASAEKHLLDNDVDNRYQACYVLSNAPHRSAETAGHLLDIIEDTDPETLRWALMALQHCELPPERTVTAMLAVLKQGFGEDENQLHYKAICMLAMLGPAAMTALPALQQAAEHGDSLIQRKAKEVLLSLTGATVATAEDRQQDEWKKLSTMEPAQAVPIILEQLRTVDKEKQYGLHQSLEALGNTAAAPLWEVLLHGHPEDRVRALPYLVKLGHDKHEICQAMLPLLDDDSEKIRQWTLSQLSRSHALDISALPAIMALIEKRSTREREIAISLLGTFGAEALPALPLLIRLAGRDNARNIRHTAMTTLKEMGSAAEPAIPALVNALGEEGVGRAAAVALASIGAPGRDAVRPLADDKDPVTRENVLVVLTENLAGDAEIFEQALQDPSIEVRNRASYALREQPDVKAAMQLDVAAVLRETRNSEDDARVHMIAELGERVLPQVIPLLTDDKPDVRQRAVECLRAMGPQARTALPPLLLAYGKADISLQEEIRRAIDAIVEEVPDWEKQWKMAESMFCG